MENKYVEQAKIHEEKLNESEGKSNIIGNVKLLCVLLLIASAVLFFMNERQPVFIAIGAIDIIVFIIFFIIHHKVHLQINYHKGLIKINNEYISRINGEWRNFTDTGEEFIDPTHDYGQDLDIIGKKSLFQLLNTTNTFHGRKHFASNLLNQSNDISIIKERQSAISELSTDCIFNNDFQYYTSKIGVKEEIGNLLEIITTTTQLIKNKYLRMFLHYFPILSSLFIAFSFIFSVEPLMSIAIVIFLLQLAIWGVGAKKILTNIGGIGKVAYYLSDYSTVFLMLHKKTFNSKKLNEIKSIVVVDEISAAKALSELNRIVQRINMRYNSVIYFLLNGLFLWDYECVYLLEEWRKKYSNHAEDWFNALGEFESLLSFSNVESINAVTTIPNITDTTSTFDATLLGHPLITESARVTNDFNAKDSIFIISGSNMSGKTTFMRTVGINMVLAKAGASVCATSLVCSIFSPVSSMRIADDLNEGISTFYAELKKVKNILDKAKSTENTFFFIDEIFRGTNSNDRLLGAKNVILTLQNLGVMGITTTHDLELCDIAEDNRIINISFSEEYKDGKILFDYKLKNGVSRVTNAKYLMEMLGII